MIDGWTMANGVRDNKNHGTAKADRLLIRPEVTRVFKRG